MADNLSFGLDNLDREAERKRSEKAARRLAKMFAALSATNEAILRAKTADELYQLVCDAAVHVGNSLAATVLLAEPDTPWLRPVSGTGEIIELVRQTHFSIDAENPYGKGVCGKAFRTQKTMVNEDILNSEQGRAVAGIEPPGGSGRELRRAADQGRAEHRRDPVFHHQVMGDRTRRSSRCWRAWRKNVSFALENFDRAEEKKRADERIQYLATHDGLTDLPNRVMFSQLFEQSIRLAQRNGRKCAVLFIDLDRFKVINDSLGHAAGDMLLIEVARQASADCVRESDVVARLGGDEFVVMLDGSRRSGRDRRGRAQDSRRLAARRCILAGHECRTTGSIGIAMYPENGSDAQTLTKNADMAMYLAKEEGKNDFRFFSPEIKTQSIERLMLETDLRHALELDQFMLHYQPKLDVATGQITGVEALLRWPHPELGIFRRCNSFRSPRKPD